MPFARVLTLLPVLCWLAVTGGVAPQDSAHDVRAAALSGVFAELRDTHDARIDGPVAFDPRIVRTAPGPAPTGWPDPVVPRWNGDVRDTALTPPEVRSLLAEVNRPHKGPAHLQPCGEGAGSRQCTLAEFPAVIALSEPMISGDTAQALVYVRYRSTIEAHPWAWFASTVRLLRVDGRWTTDRWHNQAGT